MDPESGSDNFQNLTGTPLSKDTSAKKFHEDPICRFYVKTNRHTDKSQVKHKNENTYSGNKSL